MILQRGMLPDEQGRPQISPTARKLGARPIYPLNDANGDIEADADGFVAPDGGGMSASPPPPTNLPIHRRPPRYGGTDKKLRVYEIDTAGLPPELAAVEDPNAERGRDGQVRHWFIEPARRMRFSEYQTALGQTRHLWRAVP